MVDLSFSLTAAKPKSPETVSYHYEINLNSDGCKTMPATVYFEMLPKLKRGHHLLKVFMSFLLSKKGLHMNSPDVEMERVADFMMFFLLRRHVAYFV